MIDRKGRVVIEYIGYFEELEKSFDHIRKHVKVESELKVLNRGNHSHYKKYYTFETRNIVEKVYAEDIEYLKYNF